LSTKMTVAELEVLFDANTARVDAAEKKVTATAKKIEGKPIIAKVDADATGALGSMDRVEDQAKRLVSAKTVATVDANIERAEKSFVRVYERLDYLRSVSPNLEVTADIKRAESQLSRVQRQLDGLRSARAVMEVDADTSAAESALEGAKDAAGDAGDDAGSEFGKNIVAALVSIPIAGAVIGVGVAAGKALIDGFSDGLQQEAGYDRLQALTGIDEAAALRLGRAAGEAYANNFGDSIESNMDISRLALQFDIIDENATTRDAQKVVQGLAGIADVLQEDVNKAAQATTTLLRTGMAKSAEDAFDIIAAGQREGVNRGEDLLDTFIEYPSVLTRLGLTGKEMLGLLNQSLDAGARNSDVAADALKEFQIRATDASDLSAAGFRRLGFDAEEMTAKIAAGGEGAREGLDQVLQALRDTENPVARNAAAVELFGTKAEDLGEALFAMDLTSAVDQLDGVTGAAERMFDTIADNDAAKVQQAQRNIEVAADGIKGALASAFSEPLGDFAEFVSQNRGPVMQFILDLANGALDLGVSLVTAGADGAEAFGEFVSGPGADMLQLVANLQKSLNPFADTSELDATIESMRGFDDVTGRAADTMRDRWIGNLEAARDRLNDFGEGAVALGFLNDASLRVADALAQVGVDASGAALSLEGVDLANLSATESGRLLENQIRNAVAALQEELSAAAATGESQANLTERYNDATNALAGQLTQMGLTSDEAYALIAAYGAVPELVNTTITANTTPAQSGIDTLVRTNSGREIVVRVRADGSVRFPDGNTAHLAQGAVLEFMANGGIPGLTPMAPVAQMVPANTWRVVGDRGDVPELYAPLDGSARSWALILEGLRRMPGTPPQFMAEGGVTQSPPPVSLNGMSITGQLDIGINGIARLIDARLHAADEASARTARQGRR
jgi:hypothetical protein